MNELKTQGTELYMLDDDASPDEVLKIGNLTQIGAVGGEGGDIDVTNLDDLQFKQFLVGLMDPGSPGLGLNLDPQNESHQRLFEVAGGKRYWFAIGCSEDPGSPPTISGGEWVLPSTRTWFTYQASVKSAPVEFQTDTVVKANAALRASGQVTMIPAEV